MRTIDDTPGQATAAPASDAPPRGRAARAGLPTIPLPRESAQATARTARPARAATAVPASASTGVAELLRGPVRPAAGAHEPAGGGVPVRRRASGAATSSACSPATPPACRWAASSSAPATAARWSRCRSGAPAEVGGGRIVVGDLAVSAAAWWNPRPKLPAACVPRCSPRASASCATRSTARASRTAPSPCPACRPAPAVRWPRCAAPSGAPTSTPPCAPPPA